MSATKILTGGVIVGLLVWVFSFALHLLNQPSDSSVWGGYLLILALMAGLVEAARRLRRQRQAQKSLQKN